MQQAIAAAFAAPLNPVQKAKVVKMAQPKFLSRDEYPAPDQAYYEETPIRHLSWFEKRAGEVDSFVYCFGPGGQHGYVDLSGGRRVLGQQLALQNAGWRFISLSERARQAVPNPMAAAEDETFLAFRSYEEERTHMLKFRDHLLAKYGTIPFEHSYVLAYSNNIA